MDRVTVSDLEIALEWLRAYEPAPGEDGTPIERVAGWIQAEIDARYLVHARRLLRARDKADGSGGGGSDS